MRIRTDRLSRRFALRGRGRFATGIDALSGVTLEAGPGITAVVGPNGAGKTTLFALVLGFLKPTGGTVSIGGAPPRRWLRGTGAGYLPERFRLPAGWRVRPALRALARAELPAETADRRADAWIERLELADHADKPVEALSRGLLQRVGIAQALLADHRLLVLDEPAEGLDPLWRVRLRELLVALAAEGRTILLASHELPEVERLATRVVLLSDGRLREVIDVRAPGPRLVRRIIVEGGAGHVRDAFPDARDDGARADAFLVEAADASELSARLAALLAAGTTVLAVEPAEADLEERVRRRLAEGS